MTVLYTKLIEQSRMEVLEEEELKVIKQKQKYFENLKEEAETQTKKLEEKEFKRQQSNVML